MKVEMCAARGCVRIADVVELGVRLGQSRNARIVPAAARSTTERKKKVCVRRRRHDAREKGLLRGAATGIVEMEMGTLLKANDMTALLEQAIDKLRELPSTEQDAMAAIILDELADEDRWDAAFARSQDRLAEIAEQVRADIRAGRTRDIGIDEL
jgi:hypothetical protein